MGYHDYNYDGLRYSLNPLEIVSSSSIEEYNDSLHKCLDKYGIICLKEDQKMED